MRAPNGRDYNRVGARERFVCEWHTGQGTDAQDWCSAPASWGAPQVGDYYRDGALNYLCAAHLQELLEHMTSPAVGEPTPPTAVEITAGAEMATRTTAGTITARAHATDLNDRINIDDFRPTPPRTYVCEFAVSRSAEQSTPWCRAPATWHNASSTRSAGIPGFLCAAHYEERQRIQYPPVSDATPFGRLAALIIMVGGPSTPPTLRSALSPYLRLTSRQLATFKGNWQQVAAALVVRDLRKRGLLDELLVREDGRPFDAMSRAASQIPAPAPRPARAAPRIPE